MGAYVCRGLGGGSGIFAAVLSWGAIEVVGLGNGGCALSGEGGAFDGTGGALVLRTGTGGGTETCGLAAEGVAGGFEACGAGVGLCCFDTFFFEAAFLRTALFFFEPEVARARFDAEPDAGFLLFFFLIVFFSVMYR
jgi:hypothetical protein